MVKYPSTIIRIDDRLIHGQVLVGWCHTYHIRRVVVADDEIAREEWEKQLLLMAVTSDIQAEVMDLASAVAFIREHFNQKERIMVLVASPEAIVRMDQLSLPVKIINVGGIHFKEGRQEYLPYLFLSPEEVKLFRQLMERGYTFICQDVPDGAQYDLAKVLSKKG